MKEITTSAGETIAIGREPHALTLFAGATFGIPGTVVLNGRDSVRIGTELIAGGLDVDHAGAAAALEEFGTSLQAGGIGEEQAVGLDVLDRVCALLGVEPEPRETLEERLGNMAAEQRAALGLDTADTSGLIESLKKENQIVRDDFADLCQAAGLENCDVEGAKKEISDLVQERDRLARTLGLFISTAGLTVASPEAMVEELAKIIHARPPADETDAPPAAQAEEAPPPGEAAAAPKPVKRSPTGSRPKKPADRKS